MKKQLNDYIKEIENKINKNGLTKEDKNDMLTFISFYQHERLIHLIVTTFVGICAILIFIAMIQLEKIELCLLFLILLLLFIPYIFHYYFLENSIQKLYKIYHDCKKN